MCDCVQITRTHSLMVRASAYGAGSFEFKSRWVPRFLQIVAKRTVRIELSRANGVFVVLKQGCLVTGRTRVMGWFICSPLIGQIMHS